MNNIYLIGMMGSGKSTVGKDLSKKLNMGFVDIDDDIEKIYDMKISEIFNDFGERKFRKMESAYFIEISKQQNNIFSTGGGIILQKENRNVLENNGLTFLLEANCQILLDRIAKIKNRPLLSKSNPLNDMLSIWEQRKGYYYDSSHQIINTAKLSIDDVVNQIIKQLK